MKRFVLKLTSGTWVLEIEKILKLKSEFHTICIEQNEPNFTYAARKVLQKHGAKVRYLKYAKACIQSLEDLLQFTPLLECLELESISLTTTKEPRQPITLPHLKHLKIEGCSDEILDLITGAKYMSNLEIINYTNREIVMRFMMNNPSLQSLTIGYKVLENFFQNADILTVPFRLKKLNFTGYPMIIVAYEENLKKFLKLHAPTLDHLRLPHIVTSEISQIVFTQWRNLKTLSVNVESLPTEKSFYCCMSPLLQVTTLRLHGKFPKHEVAKLFIVNFPNVVTLDIKYLQCSIWTMKFLYKIAQSLKNIEHLKIHNFFKGTRRNLEFPKLKTFFVTSSQNMALWKNFVLTHSSTLEEITVKKLFDEVKLNSKDVDDLLELPNLRKITFGSDIKTIEDIWGFFKNDYKQLNELNFVITMPRGQYIRKKIIFPCDKAFWSPDKCDKYIANTENESKV